MPAEKLSITLPDALVAQVDQREPGRSQVIARDLARYYALLAREQAALRNLLHPEEVGLVCDVLNGTRWDPQTIPQMPALLADALAEDGLAAKWGVDGASLLERVREFDRGQLFALVDAVERFWAGPYAKEHVDWGQVLA